MFIYDKDMERVMQEKKKEIMNEMYATRDAILTELCGADKLTMTRLQSVIADYNRIDYALNAKIKEIEEKIDKFTTNEVERLLQEYKEDVQGIVDKYNTEVATMHDTVTSAVTVSSDAYEKASTALTTVTEFETTVNAANANATEAKETADEAKTNADTAKTTAETAQATADEAKATADGIAETANSAKTTAEGIAETANTALTKANEAHATATTANTTATTAKATADEVKEALEGFSSSSLIGEGSKLEVEFYTGQNETETIDGVTYSNCYFSDLRLKVLCTNGSSVDGDGFIIRRVLSHSNSTVTAKCVTSPNLLYKTIGSSNDMWRTFSMIAQQ